MGVKEGNDFVTLDVGGGDSIVSWGDSDSGRNLLFGTVATYPGSGWSEKMRITNSGNVGIGTTGPAQTLHLYKATGTNYIEIDSGLNGGYIGTDGTNFALQARNSQDITFYNSAGAVRNVTITNSGNVGIGTTGPRDKLEVGAEGSVIVSAVDTQYYTQMGSSYLYGYRGPATSSGLNIGAQPSSGTGFTSAGGFIDFLTYPSGGSFASRMRIDKNGNVGIGTPSPAYKLDVQGGQINASGGFCIAGDCRANWGAVGGGYWTASGNNIYNNNSGNVGIGTTAPVSGTVGSKTLQLGNNIVVQNIVGDAAGQAMFANNAYYDGTWKYINSASAEAIRIMDVGGAGNGGISFHVAAAGTAGATLSNWDTTDIRMRITNSGNVGIGTTSPGAKLHVYGDMQLYAGSSGNSSKLYFGSETGTAAKAIFMENWWMVIQPHRNEGLKIRAVDASGNQQLLAQFNGDANAAASQIWLAPTGGNVGIGTTSPAYALDVVGSIRASGTVMGSFSGSINAANVSSGQFGANVGNGK